MKRFLVLFTLLSIGSTLFSQEYKSAVGLRLGSSLGVSYKKFIQPNKAIEGVLDLDILYRNEMKVEVKGLYLFHFGLNVDGLSAFAGPGVSAGIYVGDSSGYIMSIEGMAGFEYKFHNSPIALSFDWNPRLQMIKSAGLKGDGFAITIRYVL